MDSVLLRMKGIMDSKGNHLINSEGLIAGLIVTQAHTGERESLWDLVKEIYGMISVDKGLSGVDFQEELHYFTGINLQTALCLNMQEARSQSFLKWLVSTRRLIETIIGQSTDRFQIEKIRAQKLWYLTNRIARKILAHTVIRLYEQKNWQSSPTIRALD
ncbi:MAG: hypothetical protein BGO67_10355 [Alphaproteobacteria bacterium 41-28]|nr:MAG: hypothetical protein BGO67_10355 [Alphaproteobacteria bacterium 41-28]